MGCDYEYDLKGRSPLADLAYRQETGMTRFTTRTSYGMAAAVLAPPEQL